MEVVPKIGRDLRWNWLKLLSSTLSLSKLEWKYHPQVGSTTCSIKIHRKHTPACSNSFQKRKSGLSKLFNRLKNKLETYMEDPLEKNKWKMLSRFCDLTFKVWWLAILNLLLKKDWKRLSQEIAMQYRLQGCTSATLI